MKRNQGKRLTRSRGKEENQLSVVCRKSNGKKYFKEEKLFNGADAVDGSSK